MFVSLFTIFPVSLKFKSNAYSQTCTNNIFILLLYIDFEVMENDRFENMVEIVNMSQWKCALMMTAMVNPSAQIEPFQVSKGNEICFILFFCNWS